MRSAHRTAFQLLTALIAFTPIGSIAADSVRDEKPIEIIQGEDRTFVEYRQNGVLRIIKVVPKNGRPYYLVPADGNPHFDGLEQVKTLYPQWVIVEW